MVCGEQLEYSFLPLHAPAISSWLVGSEDSAACTYPEYYSSEMSPHPAESHMNMIGYNRGVLRLLHSDFIGGWLFGDLHWSSDRQELKSSCNYNGQTLKLAVWGSERKFK